MGCCAEFGDRRSNGMDFRRGDFVRWGPIPLVMDHEERHRHRRRRRRHNNRRYLYFFIITSHNI